MPDLDLDPATLDELERLHEAATPGEWVECRDEQDPPSWEHIVEVRDADGVCDDVASQVSATNAALIVAARNALPALIAAARGAERWRGEVKKWYDRAIRQSESRQEAELRCVELQAEAEQLRAELRALDAETTERFERACQQRDEAREEAERLRKRVAELDEGHRLLARTFGVYGLKPEARGKSPLEESDLVPDPFLTTVRNVCQVVNELEARVAELEAENAALQLSRTSLRSDVQFLAEQLQAARVLDGDKNGGSDD